MNRDEKRQVFCEDEKQRSWSWFTAHGLIGRERNLGEGKDGASKEMEEKL